MVNKKRMTETEKLVKAIKMLLDIMLSYRKGYITYEKYCAECDNIENEILSRYVSKTDPKDLKEVQ